MADPDFDRLIATFVSVFGRAPDVTARAPGRVEFIGNHTDYNGGTVIGAAINRYVWVALAPSRNERCRVFSTEFDCMVEWERASSVPASVAEGWARYPWAVWAALADHGLARPEAFDLVIHSNLPAGAGLSSSAALELSVALGLHRLATGHVILPARLAALGRHAENVHVGVPCGILDQGTSAFGRAGQLVHIDCRGPDFSRIALPPALQLWVFNTRNKHALIDGFYATRNRECLQAAERLGVKWLADLSSADLAANASALDSVQHRRASHVVGENERVGAVILSLAQGRVADVGRLLFASHHSSQHLFENSTVELDTLVDLLREEPGVVGARLTGGGFGGAVLALTTATFGPAGARAVCAGYAGRFGREPEVIPLLAADGACVLDSGGLPLTG